MVEIALRNPLARSAAQTRSKSYAQASDEVQRDDQVAMPPAWLKLRGAQFHLIIECDPFGAG